MSNGALGQSSSLSPYAGPYVTEMLGRGQALASMPYQAYMGPLSAGESQLQQQAFSGLAGLGMPPASTAGSLVGAAPQPSTAQQLVDSGGQLPGMGMTPLQFAESGGLGADADPVAMQAAQQMQAQSPVQQYMNPYLEAALQPQLEGITRDAQIAQNRLASQYARAGAFGGSRQAVADAELARGALDRMADVRGRGYAQAFDRATDLFGQDRNYGLRALDAQQRGGATQRAIEQQGIGADIRQFEQERDFPYKQTQYMQSLLQGLPISTQTYQYAEPSTASQFMGGAGGILGLLDTMGLFGNKKDGD
tara:strand:+ start:348 stop:1268 length:921 start_codon:yes stop_codon:yes gene_type:complete